MPASERSSTPNPAWRSSARPATGTLRSTLPGRCDPTWCSWTSACPAPTGLAATRSISDDPDLDGVHVVILTTFEQDDYVFEAIRSGAAGFLVKDTEPAELLRAVRTVVAGDSLLSPGATRSLVEAYATHAKPSSLAPGLSVLTDREREVMQLVAVGLTNAEIAARLFVSPLTTKTHVSRAMIKLGARDRAQLVVFAYETGLVTPGWQP